MSDKCGNCDCSDRSQCTKKGNQYGVEIIETEMNYDEGMFMEGAENDGKCKCSSCCGASCGCGCH